MKFNKILIACILLAILTMGAVSASDDNATSDNLAVNEDLNAESSVVDDAIAEDSDVGTFEDVQEKADNTYWHASFELSGKYAGSGKPIYLNKGPTVYGNGAVLDARNMSYIFHVTEYGVTLYDMTFVNSHNSASGGAIFFDNNDTDYYNVKIINCTFINCSSDSAGGAINHAEAINCTFINCHASQYSAFGVDPYRDNYAVNCTFIDCSSDDGNFAPRYDSCTFIMDSSSYDQERDFKALQKLIDDAKEGDTIVLSGDYTCSSKGIVIDKTLTIDGNGSTLDAQGLSRIFYITADNVTLKNLNLFNGYVDDYVGSLGWADYCGSVYFHRFGTVINCSFVNCAALAYGGAIYLEDLGLVANCSFINCSAEKGGAILSKNQDYFWYWSSNDIHLIIFNSTFEHCHASEDGGAIYQASCQNCTFISCYSEGYNAVSMGRAIDCIAENCTRAEAFDSQQSSIVTPYILQEYDYYHSFEYIQELIDNADEKDTVIIPEGHYYGFSSGITIDKILTIRGNGNVVLDGQGLVRIFDVYPDEVVLDNLNFIHGFSNYEGGAINFEGYDEGVLNVINCNFDECTADYGGAIYVSKFYSYKGELRVSNCVFSNCEANEDGGTLWCNLKDTKVMDCVFRNSHAGDKGGAAFSNYDTIFDSCTFISCIAEENAGAIYRGHAVKCDFYSCYSKNGFVNYNSTVSKCTFNDCIESYEVIQQMIDEADSSTIYIPKSKFLFYGEGLKIDKMITLVSDGAVFDGQNKSRIFTIGTIGVTIKGFTIINAWGSGEGSAILAPRGVFHVDNCTFINCQANRGNWLDGIPDSYVIYSTRFSEITNSNFLNCSVSSRSLINGSTVKNCNFYSCDQLDSDFRDIGLNDVELSDCSYNMDVSALRLTNCDVYNCTVTGSSGVYADSLIVDSNIYGCTFMNLSTSYGLIGRGTVHNCSFLNFSSYAVRNGEVYDCTFINGTFTAVSGSAYNSRFINCPSSVSCGFYDGDDFIRESEIVNCTFENTRSESNIVYAGYIDEWQYNIILGHIYNSSFINCSAAWGYCTVRGGAVYGCEFINCSSVDRGGAVRDSIVYDSYFENCSSEKGGAAYESQITNCTFKDCTAEKGKMMYGGILFDNISRVGDESEFYEVSYMRHAYAYAENVTAKAGEDIQLNINVKGYWNDDLDVGSIYFVANGESYYSKVENGLATFTLNFPYAYDFDIPIKYIAEDNYEDDEFELNVAIRSNSTTMSLTALKNLIESREGNFVELNSDYAFNETTDADLTDGIVIYSDSVLKIMGNGHIINAMSKSRIFNFNLKDNVYIYNITFIQGYADAGSAVLASKAAYTSASLSIKDCTFVACESYDDGGAVSSSTDGMRISVEFSNFYDIRGGAVRIDSGSIAYSTFVGCRSNDKGGAVSGKSVYGDIFIACHARNEGGAVYDGDAMLCDFINCSSSCGGAISSSNVTKCSFTNCHAIKNGGAAYFPYVIPVWGDNILPVGYAELCTFIGCYADNEGGAVWCANVTGCNFSSCHANTGGAVFYRVESHWGVHSRGYVKNSEFVGCYAEGDGGATAYVTNVTDSAFRGCHANEGGAVAHATNVLNCSFADCYAYMYGAVNNGMISDSTFVNCSAVYVSAASADVYNSTFIDCHSVDNGVIWQGSAHGCSFTDCSSQEDGGALHSSSGYDCIFVNCHANGSGGAICWGSAINSTFINCSADSGGAVYGDAANSTFINCSADYGGAVYGGSVANSTFINCHANSSGGALINGNAFDSTFKNCSAVYGGAVSYGDVTDSTFIDCRSQVGGVLFHGSHDGCTFVNCSARGILDFNITMRDRINVGGTLTVEISYDSEADGRFIARVNDNDYSWWQSGGHAEIRISDLAVGNYTVYVMFEGDDMFVPSNKSSKLTVKPGPAPIDVEITVPEVAYRDDITTIGIRFNESINANITVEVQWVDYTVEIIDGIGSLNVTDFENDYEVRVAVRFWGDEDYAPVDKSTSFAITTNPHLKFAQPISDINVGDPLRVDISSDWLPYEVNLEISGGGKVLKYSLTVGDDGKASKVIRNLKAGEYTVSVSYPGDDYYGYAKINATFRVNALSGDSGLSVSASDIGEGEDAVIHISINPNAVGGVVVNVDGRNHTVDISDGKGTLTVPDLAPGEYMVTAIFKGDSKFEASIKTVSFNVTKAQSPGQNTTVEPEVDIPSLDNLSGDGTVAIALPGDATGTVTLSVNGENYTFDVVNGVADVKIPELENGDYNYTITYSGDGKYSSFKKSDSMNVMRSSPDVNIPSLESPSDDGTVTVSLPADATGKVTLSVDGKDYTFDVVDGKADVKLPQLADGSHDYTITYSGDAKYLKFTEGGSLTVNKTVPETPVTPVTPETPAPAADTVKLTLKTVTVKKSTKKLILQATLKVNGKAVKGKQVVFKFNGKAYKAKTNAKGIAKVTVKKAVLKKLKVGKKVKYQVSYGKTVVKKSAKAKK